MDTLQDTSSGLVASAMISIVPGYISRSVAGSYDNEGIAIFCMLLTYYMWIKAVKTGSIFWSSFSALAYFYMVTISKQFLSSSCQHPIKKIFYYRFLLGVAMCF